MALSYFKSGTTDALTWGTAGTLVSGSVYYKDVNLGTVAVGDLVIGVATSGGFSTNGTRTIAVAPGSTAAVSGGFTTIQPASLSAQDADVSAGRGVVTTAGTLTLRIAVRVSVPTSEMGACAILIPAAEWNSSGTFATVLATADADGAYSLTVPAQSTVIYFGNDWNAAAVVSTATPTGSTTQTGYLVSGQFTVYVRTWTGQPAGTRNYGMSGSGLHVAGFALSVPEATGGGAQTVVPDGVATGTTLGTQVVTTTVTTAPTGVATAAAPGAPVLSALTTSAPAGIATSAAVGTPTLSVTGTSGPTGIGTGVAVGTPVLSTTATVSPTGIPSSLAAGTAALSSTVTVSPGGVASGAAVGTPTASLAGVATVEITEMVVYQTLIVTPTGVPSGAATGTPGANLGAPPSTTTVEITDMVVSITTVATSQTVSPSGVPTGVAPGTPTISPAGATVEITGMSIGIGTPSGAFVEITEMSVAINASPPSPQTVTPSGVASGALVGTPGIGTGATVEITNMVITITAAAALYIWQERVAGNWVDPDWVWMERRAGEWVPLDS